MEGWHEARSQTAVSSSSEVFFCLGIYSIFKSSQTWNRAATLLAVTAAERRQFAERTHDSRRFQEGSVPTQRRAEGIPRAGDTREPCARPKQLCVPEATVRMPEVLGSPFVGFTASSHETWLRRSSSIQKLSQMSRNPRQCRKLFTYAWVKFLPGK